MKKNILASLAVAVALTGSAFTLVPKSSPVSYAYTNDGNPPAGGNEISQGVYDACPNGTKAICATRWDITSGTPVFVNHKRFTQ